jgi:hypothetical protein
MSLAIVISFTRVKVDGFTESLLARVVLETALIGLHTLGKA